MVNKKNWLEILVMVLVLGMTVVGCDDDSTSGGSTVPKMLLLNGIPIELSSGSFGHGWDIDLGLFIAGTAPEQTLQMQGYVAGTYADNDIEFIYGTSGTTTFSMKIPLYVGTTRWTGSGKYDVYAVFENYNNNSARYFRFGSVDFNSETTTLSFTNATELFPNLH